MRLNPSAMRPSLHGLPLHPLLFAGYAVLFLFAENVQLVRTSEVVSPLAWAIAAAVGLLAVFTVLLRNRRRGALAASAVIVWFYGYGHLAGAMDETQRGPLLFVLWLAFIGGIGGLLVHLEPRAPRLTDGLNVAGAVLLAFSVSTIVPELVQAPVRAVGENVGHSGLQATRTAKRDIYYLVFDRYGSPDALQRGFGVTDNDLPDWLAEQGFAVAPGAYANYIRTTLSMASVLNLDYLDEVAQEQGRASGDYGPLHSMLQEHLVGRFLRENGYRYFHVGAWFNATRTIAIADENLEHDTTTEFQAVLYETTALPDLASLLPQGEPMPPEDEKHVAAARFQFRALHGVIDTPGPKFVLAHILLPHDPYTFDEDGNYVPVSGRRGVP
ncbi:MAG: hypothetical protein M3253_03805, partial [Chloroflexota bacterium]|nr:hypothetical protein [Chloroflexota bacterium]